VDNEAHEYLMYRGMYDGLTAAFGDYYPAMRHDESQAKVATLRAQYARLARHFGYEVPIPLNSLLEVANRENNQRRFDNAREALHLADSLYPGARNIGDFRVAVEQYAAESAQRGWGPVVSRIAFKPAARADAARLLGAWKGRSYSPDPSFHEITSSYEFTMHGDTLMIAGHTDGVAFDGGTLRGAPSIVELRGNRLRWDFENQGGGRVLVTAELRPDGVISATTEVVDGRPLPPGFSPPVVLMELKRKPAGVPTN
jgi:hypothetical protein